MECLGVVRLTTATYHRGQLYLIVLLPFTKFTDLELLFLGLEGASEPRIIAVSVLRHVIEPIRHRTKRMLA